MPTLLTMPDVNACGFDFGSAVVDSAGALEGRAIAVIVMSGFGALWMGIGVNSVRRLNSRTIVIIAALTGILCWGASREWQAARKFSAPQGTLAKTEWDPGTQRAFQWVLALEFIPIFAVAFILARTGRPHLIIPAVALIVGLHFLPLAKIFGYRLYYFTGGAIIASALAPLLITNARWRQATTGFGCGIVLWITSVLLLVYR